MLARQTQRERNASGGEKKNLAETEPASEVLVADSAGVFAVAF